MASHHTASEPSSSVRPTVPNLPSHRVGSPLPKFLNERQQTAALNRPTENAKQFNDNASTAENESKKHKNNDQKRSRVDEPKLTPESEQFTTKPTKGQAKKPTLGFVVEDQDNRKSANVIAGISRSRVVNASLSGLTVEAKSKKSRAKEAKRQRPAEAKRLEEKILAAAKLLVKVDKNQQTIGVKAGAQNETEPSKKTSEAEKREIRRLRQQRYRHRRQARERELVTQLSGQTVPSDGARGEDFVEKVEQQGDEREVQQLRGTQLPSTIADPPMLPAEPYPKPDNNHHNENQTNVSRSSRHPVSAMPDMVSRDPTGRYQGNNYDPEYHRKRSAFPPSPARTTALISPRTRYAYDAKQKRYYSKTPEFEHQRERYHPYARGHFPDVHGPRFGPIDYARPSGRGDMNQVRGRYDDGRGYDRRHDGPIREPGRPTKFYQDRARHVPPRHDPHRYCSSSCDERPTSESPRPSKIAHAQTRLSADPGKLHHEATHESSASSSPSSASSSSASGSPQQITTPPLAEQQPQDGDGNGQALDSLAKLLQLQADVQASGQNQRLDPVKIAEMAQSFLANQTRLEGSSPPDLNLTPEQVEEKGTPSRETELREILLARQKGQHPDQQESNEASFGTKQDVSEEGKIAPSPTPQVIVLPTEGSRTPVADKNSQGKRDASPSSSTKARAAQWAKRMSPVKDVDPTLEAGVTQPQPKLKPPRGLNDERHRRASDNQAQYDGRAGHVPAHGHVGPRYDARTDSA
ncbi:hypothetical protein JCM24511_07785 [Saitozyma sp. JCM 24511]|nr:hypothetical protein JCM24511_07785 [Saitozyma sp. JCM 24511]